MDFRSLWEGSMLLVDKPSSWTSFDVVNKIRYALKLPGRKMKVGHAGTLDPLATGLLILCTGKFTKKISELQGLDKRYTGTIRLGATTPSYDAETPVDQTWDTSALTEEQIRAAAQSFVGTIEQIPPQHSAIKIDGIRAYESARAGNNVRMRSRSVEIKSFDISRIEGDDIHFDVHCSKGTYIRSLAFDLGRKLDNGGYLAALRRTSIGSYTVDDAWTIDDLVAFIDAHKETYRREINEAGS